MGLRKEGLDMISQFFLILTLTVCPLQGLNMSDTEGVTYIHSNRTVAVADSVTLLCGSPPPDIFIWGFTKLDSDVNVALAYNYGHGPIVEALSTELGQLDVIANTSSLHIEDIHAEAQGIFTCQALYDEQQGFNTTFYFTNLTIVD